MHTLPDLVVRVCCVLQVWSDGHKKARGDPNYLTLWKPVAPAGYVAMGLVASTAGKEPASMPQVCLWVWLRKGEAANGYAAAAELDPSTRQVAVNVSA
jgi:hypothetical protein